MKGFYLFLKILFIENAFTVTNIPPNRGSVPELSANPFKPLPMPSAAYQGSATGPLTMLFCFFYLAEEAFAHEPQCGTQGQSGSLTYPLKHLPLSLAAFSRSLGHAPRRPGAEPYTGGVVQWGEVMGSGSLADPGPTREVVGDNIAPTTLPSATLDLFHSPKEANPLHRQRATPRKQAATALSRLPQSASPVPSAYQRNIDHASSRNICLQTIAVLTSKCPSDEPEQICFIIVMKGDGITGTVTNRRFKSNLFESK